MPMKKMHILIVLCLFAALALSSCRSSKTCPAYRSVSYAEQTVSETLRG